MQNYKQLLHDLINFEALNNQDNVFSILNQNHTFYLTNSNETDKILNPIHKSACVIQRNLKKFFDKIVFKRIKCLLYRYSQENPAVVMRRINISEANLFDRISSHFLAFRLAGETFPPVIVYKIFTKPHTINLRCNVKQDFCVPAKRRKKDSRTSENDWKPVYCYKNRDQIPIRKHHQFQLKPKRNKHNLSWINSKYREFY